MTEHFHALYVMAILNGIAAHARWVRGDNGGGLVFWTFAIVCVVTGMLIDATA